MKKAILLSAWAMIAFVGIVHAANPGDSTSKAIPATKELLQEIITVTGLQSNFILKEADVMNIEASISRKVRYILYNPAYIQWINNATRSKWATMALLAHEMGHHLNGHTLRKGGSNPSVELEADEFAGHVLAKLGASLEQAQLIMYYIAKPVASSTHPARQERMDAISRGWQQEIDKITERYTEKKP